MIKIECKDLCVDFSVYGSNARSFKKSLIHIATGGTMTVDAKEKVSVRALENINLNIHEGDRIGLIGHNGSGKTTLLRVFAGTYEPTSGIIDIRGNISSMLSITLGLDMDATGMENIYFRGAIMGLKKSEVDKIAGEIIEFSELGDYIYMPMRTYSSGMTMRLAFGIATSVKADIILMDEWLSVGDKNFSKKAQKRLGQMVGQAKILILASHDPSLIAHNCTKILKMEHGRIINTTELIENSSSTRKGAENYLDKIHVEKRPLEYRGKLHYKIDVVLIVLDKVRSTDSKLIVQLIAPTKNVLPGQTFILVPYTENTGPVRISLSGIVEGEVLNNGNNLSKSELSPLSPLVLEWTGSHFNVIRIENAIEFDQEWMVRIYSSILATLDYQSNVERSQKEEFWSEVSRAIGTIVRGLDSELNSFFIRDYIDQVDRRIPFLTGNLRDTGVTVTGDIHSRSLGSTGFMLRHSSKVRAIWLKIGVVGKPKGELNLDLHLDDLSGRPGSPVISSNKRLAAISAENFMASSECAWTRFELQEELILLGQTMYHVVVSPSSEVDDMNYWIIRQSDDDSKYTRGYSCQGEDESTWTRYLTFAWCFIVEGYAMPPEE